MEDGSPPAGSRGTAPVESGGEAPEDGNMDVDSTETQ